jgi:hypothetical protein
LRHGLSDLRKIKRTSPNSNTASIVPRWTSLPMKTKNEKDNQSPHQPIKKHGICGS